jgi:cytoskeletal protein CcmA (bactofilin family)
MPSQFIGASSAFKSPTSSLAKVAISITSVLLLSSTQVFAQTWDGGGPNSNFNTGTNWSANANPTVTSDVTINGGGGVNQPILSTAATVNSVAISAGSLLVDGVLTAASGITVSGSGKLDINPSGSVSGNVSNSSSRTLTNNGSIFGNVTNSGTFTNGGFISGNVINNGTFTMTPGSNIVGSLSSFSGLIDVGASQHQVNAFTQSGGSLRIDLSDNTSAALVVSGNANLGGSLNLDFAGFSFGSDIDFFRFDLLRTRGILTGDFAEITLNGFDSDFSFSTELTDLKGTGFDYSGVARRNVVTAVPEPETYAMMLAGLGLVGAIARRRKVVLAA